MAVKKYFDTLGAEDQEKVMELVSQVIDQVSITDEETQETRVNLDMLRSVIEKLSAERKSAKEAEEKLEKETRDERKKAATAAGAELVKTMAVGDIARFTMGSGKNVKTYELEILKITDKTITVEFAGDVFTPNGGQGKRYIPLAKVLAKVESAAEETTDEVSEEVAA